MKSSILKLILEWYWMLGILTIFLKMLMKQNMNKIKDLELWIYNNNLKILISIKLLKITNFQRYLENYFQN